MLFFGGLNDEDTSLGMYLFFQEVLMMILRAVMHPEHSSVR
mgnify:CR=1 FL=1